MKLIVILILIQLHCASYFEKKILVTKNNDSICFNSFQENTVIKAQNQLTENELTILKKHFSLRAISISVDIGAEDYLLNYINIKKKGTQINKKNSSLKQARDNILTAYMEVSSMTAIVDCERDRAMQFASFLDSTTANESRRLSFNSLISTIAGTSLAALIELSGGTNQAYLFADVSLAFIAGYFAYQSFNINVTGNFDHKQNLIKEIKENPETPRFFYKTVWNFLVNENYPNEPSERIEILQIWYRDGFTKSEEVLFFSDGGEYDSAKLYKLILKLDTLKTRMSYMNLELRTLQQEIKLLEKESQ